jgi:hypothetical protein
VCKCSRSVWRVRNRSKSEDESEGKEKSEEKWFVELHSTLDEGVRRFKSIACSAQLQSLVRSRNKDDGSTDCFDFKILMDFRGSYFVHDCFVQIKRRVKKRTLRRA